MAKKRRLDLLDVDLDRDTFLRDILRELSGTLQNVVGIEQARGFVSLVGQRIGERLNAEYRTALEVERLEAADVGDVLVDLKQRIHGNFSVAEHDENKIVLTNTRCPFGDHVSERPALCMMTSNVFGTIAAENLGYARVQLDKTIAEGDAGCRVIVHLEPSDDENIGEREYFALS